jgi:hypothetical protein
MPSAFFETPLRSYLTWHKVDTGGVTGGSTGWRPNPDGNEFID